MKSIESFTIPATYAEACNELVGSFPCHCTRAKQLLAKKCNSGGEPLATLCPIWPAQDLNLMSPARETNALPLGQPTGGNKKRQNYKFLISSRLIIILTVLRVCWWDLTISTVFFSIMSAQKKFAYFNWCFHTSNLYHRVKSLGGWYQGFKKYSITKDQSQRISQYITIVH